jgi:hypothetical protein
MSSNGVDSWSGGYSIGGATTRFTGTWVLASVRGLPEPAPILLLAAALAFLLLRRARTRG